MPPAAFKKTVEAREQAKTAKAADTLRRIRGLAERAQRTAVAIKRQEDRVMMSDTAWRALITAILGSTN